MSPPPTRRRAVPSTGVPTEAPRASPSPGGAGRAARAPRPARGRPVVRSLPVVPAGAATLPFRMMAYDEVVERDTRWGEHSHPFHELLWNERGASSTVVGSRVWTITPALGLWMPAGTLHSGAAVAGTWLRTTFFGFHSTPSLSDTPVAVQITPLLRLLLERLDEPNLSPGSREVTEAMVLDVLRPSPHALLVHEPTSALLRPIAEAVTARPGGRWTLADWADRLGVSTRTISRAFVAETGTSFVRWVASVRAQHAIALLTQGWDVESVAGEVGYRSASAFGAAFRRTTGLSPGAFRAS